MNGAVDTHAVEAQNKVIIEDAFTVWLAGTGSPFDLLAEDATWTIVGRSTVAKAAALAIGRFPAPHATAVRADPARHFNRLITLGKQRNGTLPPTLQLRWTSDRSHSAPPGGRIGHFLCRDQ
jgi:hypothetical protein